MILDKIMEVFNNKDFFSGNIKTREPMKSHTTMNVGGPVPLFLEPFDEKSLIFAAKTLAENKMPFFILGGGSNTIFADSSELTVVTTRKMQLENGIPELRDGKITVSAGSSWGSVISFCKENEISGFEPFTGLSGTVGGAIYMNATCFGLTTSDRLVSVRYLDLSDFSVKEYKMDEADWGYKKSPFQSEGGVSRNLRLLDDNFSSCRGESSVRMGCGEDGTAEPIILSATFSVSHGKFNEELSKSVIEKRKNMGHFMAPSAGSVFKNDPENGLIAGKIIDECGLKGKQEGGAKIADWHGNFIVNTGNSTAKDIKNLVDSIRKEVKKQKNIDLECEILFVG